MTHNLAAVAHIADNFQQKMKLPIIGRSVISPKKRAAPNTGGAGQRVGPRTQGTPEPVVSSAPVLSVPNAEQSSRFNEAWQGKQAAGTLSTDQHEDLASSAAPTKTVHSPVQPTTRDVTVVSQGWSKKDYSKRAGKMPTAQDLFNGTQAKAAVKPKKSIQHGPTIDLSAWDNPSV